MKILRRSSLAPSRYIHPSGPLSPHRARKLALPASLAIALHALENGHNVVPQPPAPEGPPNLDVIPIMPLYQSHHLSAQADIRMPLQRNASAPILKELELGRMPNSVNVTSFRP